MSIKTKLLNNLSQIPGWHTNRKIIVIESDDWGSIRMKSSATINSLNKMGIDISDPYNLNDSLASEQDLAFLFETLVSFKDKNGNHPIVTANAIIANPDFEKIKNSDYTEYHYEIFTDTLKKYPNHVNSFKLWKEGMNNNLFHPQYHGREHVNIFRWLKELKNKNSKVRLSFEHEIFGLRNSKMDMRDSYMRALDFQNINELKIIEDNLIEGIEIFNAIFGYYSKSFIAPSYVWNSTVEKELYKFKVKYLQGISYQYIPEIGKEKLTKKLHYLGQKNKQGQIYLVRNAFFEPSLNRTNHSVEDTLHRINLAFKWNKPAIIGSHRLNYIGYVNEKNRDKNLKLFAELLKEIIKKWPDVEFMSSDQLGDLITKSN